jgi:hypothetical protein
MRGVVVSLVALAMLLLVGSCVNFREPPREIYPNPKETPGNYKLDQTGY